MVNYPKDWEITTIGKCGQLIKNSINPQLLPKTYFWEYSMPAFDENRRPHKRLGENMLSNRIAIKGNVLLFNKLNVRQKRIWLIEKCFNNSICSSEFLPYYSDTINLYFLSKLLSSDKVTRDFIEMSVGSSNSQKRIRPKDFMNYPICIPSNIEEQRLIAEKLSQFDTYISDLDELIVKKRNIRDGALEDLVTGKTRLNGFNGKWINTTLGKEFCVTMGQSPKSDSYNSLRKGVPLIQGNADIEKRITVPKRYTSNPTKICNSGDTILTVRAPVGSVSRANQQVCLGRGVCAIHGIINSFIYYLMLSYEKYWESISQGSTFTAVTGDFIRNFKIFITPNISEQQAIADVLMSMDNEIESLEMERDKMIQIREGAMDELLTGRVRLTK